MDIEDVRKVTIAGCGTEGSQISSMVAYKGFQTTVWLRSEGSIERAKPRLETVRKQILAALDAWEKDPAEYCRGLSDDRDLTAEQIEQLKAQASERLSRIRLTTDMDEAFGDADVVIECINEDPDQKRAFYQKARGATCPRGPFSLPTPPRSCPAPLRTRPAGPTAT
jgi:3-hydroxybutyryl-CoA dehydrogenase